MTKKQKLAEGWETMGKTLKPGSMTDDALKANFEIVVDHFDNLRMSSQDADNLTLRLIKLHTFFPSVAEILQAWEAVKPPYPRPWGEKDEELPEAERPLTRG